MSIQAEIDRDGVLHSDGSSVLHAGFPLGHCGYYPPSFFIKQRVYTFQHAYILNGAILLYYKIYKYTPLYFSLSALGRIIDICLEVIQ